MILSKKFYLKTKKRYKKRNLEFDSEELKALINNLYYQAKQNYSQLSKPKLCSQKAYISIWLNQEIAKDIAQKSLASFSTNSPPDKFKSITEFYKNYPPIFPKSEPNKIKNNLKDKKQKWLAVVRERNEFSLNKSNQGRVYTYLNDFHIPRSEYKDFLANANKIIIFCKKQIYSTWKPKKNQNLDNYCLVCRSNIFPFKTIDDFLVFFKEKNKSYKDNKIKIEFSNESRTEYIKEDDTFKITINKNTHINHQIIELIHELGHIETMAKIFKQNKFIEPKAYCLEKLAIRKEVNFLVKYFPNALIAKLGSILKMIYQTLFEIEIYQYPTKNSNKIYLKYFKKCSKNVNQKDSWNYLSNQDILYKNFTQLIYAIAYTNVLKEKFNL